MTRDFFLSQIRLILVTVISYCAGRGYLTSADAGLVTAILTPAGLLLGPFLWSAYVNIGSKLVPHDSVAVKAIVPTGADKPSIGDHVSVSTDAGATTVAAKVVGALLFAVILAGSFSPAYAQIKLTGNPKVDFAPKTAPATGVNVSGFQQGLSAFNEGVQKITKDLVDIAVADVQAALDDATKRNDEISIPCWQAHLNLFKNFPVEWENPPKMPIGIALGIQIQRDILNSINGTSKGTLKVDCAALYGDELKTLAGIGALLGIRVASSGLL